MTLERAIQILDRTKTNHLTMNISEYDEALAISSECISEKIERDNPKPLTLDELRNMNGEPVWVVQISGVYENFDGKWSILFGYEKTNGNFLFTNSVGVQHVYNEEKYGESWVAYKHKPKERN